MARVVPFLAGLFLAVPIAGAAASCTPAQRETVREVAPPLVRATCVFLRAFTSDGRVDEVCATAEDLAPFISEIEALHRSRGVVEPQPSTVLAFSLPAPSRPVPRRRCVAWAPIAPLPDGGTEGGDGGP